MAITVAAIRNSNGITYTRVVDSSADYATLDNDTYFLNKEDRLIRYKDAGGTVATLFGGGGGAAFPFTGQALITNPDYGQIGLSVDTSILSFTESNTFLKLTETSVNNSFSIQLMKVSGFNRTTFLTGGNGNGLNTEREAFTIIGDNYASSWTGTTFPKNLSVGYGNGFGLTARLDVIAQGALSTDIVFRVRNSADTANLLSVTGDGNVNLTTAPYINYGKILVEDINFITYSSNGQKSITFGHEATLPTEIWYSIAIGGSATSTKSGATVVGTFSWVGGDYGIALGYGARVSGNKTMKIGYHQGYSSFGGLNSIHLGATDSGNDPSADNIFAVYFNSQIPATITKANGSLGLLGQTAYVLGNGTGIYGLDTFMGTGGNTLVIANHASVPSAGIVNSSQMYSADIVAGNSAPHFLTEAGDLIKLYKQDLPTDPTNAQIATFLSNLGLANLI